MYQAKEIYMDSINELIGPDPDRLDLAEICCHPESELSVPLAPLVQRLRQPWILKSQAVVMTAERAQ